METIEAIYENGVIKFDKNPPKRKSKVLVTFLDENENNLKFDLPSYSLGEFLIPERKDIYVRNLSD